MTPMIVISVINMCVLPHGRLFSCVATNRVTAVFTKSTKGFEELGERGRTRERANREISEHLGARRANVVHPFEIRCMRAAQPAQTRALVNVTVKKLMVVDDVGFLFSPHCCSYHGCENNYSFGALQAYCFGINIKL